MPDIEAIGDAVTGGMVARAVEPGGGEHGHTHESRCLNCGCDLTGAYCHCCGQKAHVHRTLGAFFHDLLHGVLHFEGKIWRTLPMLAWRPGELTRRYVNGQRASFVSPVALFLFSVFLMFAIFSILGGPMDVEGTGPSQTTPEGRAEARRDHQEERGKDFRRLTQLKAERQTLAAAGDPTLELDIDIRNLEREIALRDRLFEQAMDLVDGNQNLRAGSAAEASGEAPDPEAGSGLPNKVTILGGANSINDWFNRAYKKAKKNPSLLLYKLQTNAYKFSWALIPISVPFVWLLFLHRRRYRQYKAYDHTVFVTYSITFMSLGVIVLTLLRPLGLPGGAAAIAMTLIPPIHMYRQLRGAYELSRWSALWRTFALLFFAVIAAGLFAVLLLMVGVAG